MCRHICSIIALQYAEGISNRELKEGQGKIVEIMSKLLSISNRELKGGTRLTTPDAATPFCWHLK